LAKFKFPKTFESKPFWGNNEAITSALLELTGSGTDVSIALGLCDTYDGTYTYETVAGIDPTENVNTKTHNFTATGKWIKWQIVGLTYTVTNIEITINP